MGTGREWKKSIPEIREREGNEKNPFPKFGNGKGMKKNHSRNSGRESEASILGNDREREFPLTPATRCILHSCHKYLWACCKCTPCPLWTRGLWRSCGSAKIYKLASVQLHCCLLAMLVSASFQRRVARVARLPLDILTCQPSFLVD